MARTVNAVEHAARRQAILDAVEQLIMSKGYEDLTVQDVLDRAQISKGAFYHYFDGKPAVIEALTDRMVSESEQVLAPIVSDGELGAVDKLRLFFGEIARLKSGRQDVLVAMLPVWYAPENVAFKRKVDTAVAERLAPLLATIAHQGVAEKQISTTYPDRVGVVVLAIIQAFQDATAAALLAAARDMADTFSAGDVVAIHGAHFEAIERCLDIPEATLGRIDADTVTDWIVALHRAPTPT